MRKKKGATLGCCGYDELAEKPPTTQPIRFGTVRVSNVERANEPGVTRRISSMGSENAAYPVLNLGQVIPSPFTEARDQLAREFMGKWGIVGVGDGHVGDRLSLEVMTTGDPKIIAGMLPTEYLDFPIVVIPSGGIEIQ